MPVDWHWLTYAYLTRVNPKCSLIMETELWPNYYEYFYYKGITNIIVNARLSERTTKAPKFVQVWITHACQFVSYILARSEEDAELYIALGAQPEYVKVIGNIKYAVKPPQDITSTNLSHPYVLFASSRNGEEKLIVNTWLSLREPKPLLVIVPRHIQRLDDILSNLKGMSNKIAIRSRQESVTEATEIYIADTFGELTSFIHGSQFVIMGGSFMPFGGQNIIEVGQAGKAVIFGPHMENFKMEAEQFVQADAAIQASNLDVLSTTVVDLLNKPERVKQLGENGKGLVNQHEHIVEDYLSEIEKHCRPLNS